VSLRRRLTVAGGGAVFVALVIASLVIYFSVRSNLNEQTDASLIQSAQNVATKWLIANGPKPTTYATKHGSASERPLFGSDASGYSQVIPNVGPAMNRELSVVAGLKNPLKQSLAPFNGFVRFIGMDALVARGLAPPYFRDVRYRGVAMALYTMPLSSASDGLVRTARPLTEANATIARPLAAVRPDARWGARGGPARTTGRERGAAARACARRRGARGERHA
jgi:hypothetical protein